MFRRLFLNERNMMFAILVNAVVIFLLYFPDLRENQILDIIDHAFIVFFLLEAVIKMNEIGTKAYFRNRWNQFDFFLVVISLPSLLMNFLPIPDTSLLLILRLFRLIRLVRFFTFIPNMSKILDGLGRALKSSVFVLLALFFLNFMLAIFTCHFYGQVSEELFGNPLRSFYSIFQMFTVEGWNEIPATVAEELEHPVTEWLMRFYFGTVVLIGGIFGMSLANAVFVDEMTMDNNQSLEITIEELKTELQEIKSLIKNINPNQEESKI